MLQVGTTNTTTTTPGFIFPNYFQFFIFFIAHVLFVEWSGEVRSITYSTDAKSVSVVYRVTLYGTDAEVQQYSYFHFFSSNLLIFSVGNYKFTIV